MARRFLPLRRVGLAAFFFVHGSVYWLISWLGYTFIPVHEMLQVGLALAVILALTIDGLRKRHDRTRYSRIGNALLPIIALFFVLSFADHSGESPFYLLLFITAFLCSMVLFFACTQNRTVKIILGVIHAIILIIPILIFTLALLGRLFAPLSGPTLMRQSELSPNGVYLAEVIDRRDGQYSDIGVNITRQGRDLNLLVGELRLRPQTIYVARWRVFVQDLTLHWETDGMLHITYSDKYGQDIVRFERQGDAWVRLND